MKRILSILFAAVLLLAMLGGCARDMSGENRTTPAPAATSTPKPTATAKPTDGAVRGKTDDDSTADGVIDEGKDAVNGVVGAGEEAVDDVVDAAEDAVDDITGADSTSKPAATAGTKAKQ